MLASIGSVSPLRSEKWINNRVSEVNQAVTNSDNFERMQAFFHRLYDVQEISQKTAVDDVSAWIVDTGLQVKYPDANDPVHKSTDVMVKQGAAPAILLLKSTDLRKNYNFMPTKVQISPDHRYVSVSASQRGSLDAHTIIVFETGTWKELGRVEADGEESILWIKPDIFRFRSPLKHEQKEVSIVDGKLSVVTLATQNTIQDALNGKVLYIAGRSTSSIWNFGEAGGKVLTVSIGGLKDVVYFDSHRAVCLFKGANEFGVLKQIRRTDDNRLMMKSLIPESDHVIDTVKILGEQLVATTHRGSDRRIEVLTASGDAIASIQVPLSSDASFSAIDLEKSEIQFTLSSPVRKSVSWKYEIKSKNWFIQSNGGWKSADVDTEMLIDKGVQYVVEYVDYKSKDGATIPMRVTRRQDLQKNGQNPVIAQGYGGFNANNHFYPTYSAILAEFLKRGGIHVAPALRGGGYFGKPWHDAGRQFNKQNVVDDFIAGIEWTIDQKWTSNKLIAATGGSHGGLLVGALITQRPDLIGLAFPQFGLHDFARKAELDRWTTPYQVTEYGDLIKDPAAIAYATRISPFANAVPASYPMTVVATGRDDSRVNATHSYLFGERLRQNRMGTAPIYMFALKNAGHWSASAAIQDSIAWRYNAVYWTLLFDFFGMQAP